MSYLQNGNVGYHKQTPIEIALQVDKDGKTTARKLYEFLELDKSNYSRWCKSNIEKNAFAEENVDFWAFVINDEWGGQATTDYKLTATFAKKLAMGCQNERGEQARQYFIKVEDMMKEETTRKSNAAYLPKATSLGEVASFLKEMEKVMKAQESSPKEIATAFEMVCKQFGVGLPDHFVKVKAWEQVVLFSIE